MSHKSELHFAVVILNWNGRKHLETYLPSVMQTRYANHKVWVIDNASTDDSVDWLHAQYGDAIGLVQLQQNGGYAGGYQAGLAPIQADIYVLLNSDVEVEADWLDAVATAFVRDEQLGAAQPHILDWRKRQLFEYAGAAGGYIDALGYPFCAGRLFEQIEVDQGQYQYQKEIFWASGACMFIRSSAYWEAGGLDSRYFAHMEEIDLCWRLHHLGYKLLQIPESVVYHLGGGSLAYGNPRKTFLNFRNSLITLQKNLPFSELIYKLPMRLLLDAPAALKFLSHGSFGDFWAVVRAHWSFFGMQAYVWKARKAIPHKRPSSQISTIFKGSTLYAHFFSRRRKMDAFIADRRI